MDGVGEQMAGWKCLFLGHSLWYSGLLLPLSSGIIPGSALDIILEASDQTQASYPHCAIALA